MERIENNKPTHTDSFVDELLEYLRNKPAVQGAGLGASLPKEIGTVLVEGGIPAGIFEECKAALPHRQTLVTPNGSYILDETGRTILLFKSPIEGKFQAIYSPRDESSLNCELHLLPKELADRLRTYLGISQPSEETSLLASRMMATLNAENANLDRLRELPPIGYAFGGSLVGNGRGFVQKEYAITDATSSTPIIGTFGLGPCVALVLFDVSTRVGAVAHIDATTNVASIHRMLTCFDQDADALRVSLIGGDRSSRGLILEIQSLLESNGLKISHADVMERYHPSAFSLDCRTGEICEGVYPQDIGADVDLRLTLAGLGTNVGIQCAFDGRVQIK